MPSVSLWDLVRQFLGQTPHLKNAWTIDPNGAAVTPIPPHTDNRSQIDPNGATAPPIPAHTDNNWTIDPNG
jgi:hypothetical protein